MEAAVSEIPTLDVTRLKVCLVMKASMVGDRDALRVVEDMFRRNANAAAEKAGRVLGRMVEEFREPVLSEPPEVRVTRVYSTSKWVD